MCLNRLFAAAFISDGVTSKPSTGNLVNEWAVYDNSGDTPILLVEEKTL